MPWCLSFHIISFFILTLTDLAETCMSHNIIGNPPVPLSEYELYAWDLRYSPDILYGITLVEIFIILVATSAKGRFTRRATAAALLAILLCVRLRHMGAVGCLPGDRTCCTSSGMECPSIEDDPDVNLAFGQCTDKYTVMWADKLNACPMPRYYVTDVIKSQSPMCQLDQLPNYYECYIHGCNARLSPVRYVFKFTAAINSLLSCVLLVQL